MLWRTNLVINCFEAINDFLNLLILRFNIEKHGKIDFTLELFHELATQKYQQNNRGDQKQRERHHGNSRR